VPSGAGASERSGKFWHLPYIITLIYLNCGILLLAQHAPPILIAHLVGDAHSRQPDEFGEWRIRPA
jgi:hypothetical protein